MCASRTCISRLGTSDDHLEDVTIGEHGFSRGVFDLVDDGLARRLAEESLMFAMRVSCIRILNILYLSGKGSDIELLVVKSNQGMRTCEAKKIEVYLIMTLERCERVISRLS